MDKRDEIRAKYFDGESVIELAKQYNLTRERIYQYLREMEGWKRAISKQSEIRKEKRLLSHSDLLPRILELREKGIGMYNIAKSLGTTYRVVSKLLAGMPCDNSMKAKDKRNKAINRDYLKGMSQEKLAVKYNLCQSSISAILLKTNNGKLPQRPKNRA